jgi:DNA-binding NarL/FixJ family response regulator
MEDGQRPVPRALASGKANHSGPRKKRPRRPPLTLRSAAEELARREGLTDRQTRIVELLTAGMRSKAIAAELGIDYRTVAEHIARACAKLAVSDGGELKARLISVLIELAERP